MPPGHDHSVRSIPLDLEGFHESPFNRTLGKSFVRIVRTMIYLGISVSDYVIFCAGR